MKNKKIKKQPKNYCDTFVDDVGFYVCIFE